MKPDVAQCLLVTKVLVADGVLTDAERAFLEASMRGLGLTDEEQASVLELEGWAAAEPLVADLETDEKHVLLALLVDAASADGRLSPHEFASVKKIARALGLA